MSGDRLSDVTEEELLARILPLMRGEDAGTVLVGPGDDTAWVSAPDGRYLATTDAMVRGHDWLDAWSSPQDVGHKTVAQNLADIAAMGGVPTGLLVTVAADAATPVAWLEGLAEGIAEAATAAGVPVVGGDLSGADGTVMVSTTAFGSTEGRSPVLRSGAQHGDVVAVAGTLGRSGAGFELLDTDRRSEDPALVRAHLRPTPPLVQGPRAARLGAHAMLDLSDGLLRDAGRLARASSVVLDLSSDALRPHVDALAAAVGEERAWEHVLTGGEEHSLLATFESAPSGWHVLGRVRAVADAERPGVHLDGRPRSGGGWDHFDASR